MCVVGGWGFRLPTGRRMLFLPKAWPVLMVLGIGTLPVDVSAGQYRVGPDRPYKTIQSAIDAVDRDPATVDEVIVDNGKYTGEGNFEIDFKGKALTLRSEDPNGFNSFMPECTIDPNRAGRAFYFHSGEGPNSIVDGFVIWRGYAKYSGGGILCTSGSSPTFRRCRIISCRADEYGGGIACYSSSLMISNCKVWLNKARFGGGIYAGGTRTSVPSAPKISNSIILANRASHLGGGIHCSEKSAPTVVNCTICENEAMYGNGAYVWGNSTLTLVNTILWGNHQAAEVADIWIPIPRAAGYVRDTFGKGVAGVPVRLTVSTPKALNITAVTDRNGYYEVPGYNDSQDAAQRVTFLPGFGSQIGVGDFVGDFFAGKYYFTVSNVRLQYCCVQDGIKNSDARTFSFVTDVTGNITDDPCFVDTEYHIGKDSRCYNAGDPSRDYTGQMDYDGQHSRLMYGRVDIGADEFFDPNAGTNPIEVAQAGTPSVGEIAGILDSPQEYDSADDDQAAPMMCGGIAPAGQAGAFLTIFVFGLGSLYFWNRRLRHR